MHVRFNLVKSGVTIIVWDFELLGFMVEAKVENVPVPYSRFFNTNLQAFILFF